MIKINSLKLNIDKANSENEINELAKAAARKLRCREAEISDLSILKKSIDARDKNNILFIYNVCLKVNNEQAVLKKCHDSNVGSYLPVNYDINRILSDAGINLNSRLPLTGRPVVIGFGPAGMLCALKLAECGYKPLVIERGGSMDERVQAVNHFWESGELNPETNVQFGEGGAGAFSDGKLNTMVSDPSGRIPEVFRVFVEHGANPEITYLNKPHVGTDVLHKIVTSIREKIIRLGGEVSFNTCLKDVVIKDGAVSGILVSDSKLPGAGPEFIECSVLVLATGHSSRDTFRMLYSKGLSMEAKSFAVGFRVRHEQEMIGLSQYGSDYKRLPAADYKLTFQADNGRGVYSFCMCPGGYVVNASSENERLCVNGMSYSGRDGKYANSAIVVTVNAEDFGNPENIFSGMEFQEKLEHEAYLRGNGKIPVQYYSDFIQNTVTDNKELIDEINRDNSDTGIKGQVRGANLRGIYPEFIDEAILQAMPAFGRKIKGFDRDDTMFLGIETRTSSPLRINRNENFVSVNTDGIYPCGEGAGYAGGITSAAVDGIKVFEHIYRKFRPMK